MKFTKMHGCGNDYIYVEGKECKAQGEEKAALVRALSDRHVGIGGDGVIFIHPGQAVDFEMEMYNADGSRAEMCGNGIRCVGKYVFDQGLTDKTFLLVESMGAVKRLWLTVVDGKVRSVRVDMGSPILRPRDIPVLSDEDRVVDKPIWVEGEAAQVTCVSMGNPHAVVFVDDVKRLVLDRGFGEAFEHHPMFPNRTNVEFVKVLERKSVEMRVWERGTGETLACGTGCCAVAVAGVLNGLTDTEITVKVLGGELQILWDRRENTVYMTGPAVTVFEGDIDLDTFK
jgi:diaminopimelate epimerase